MCFEQDLLVISKSRKETVAPFSGIYPVRAGGLPGMLGQVVPAIEFIPDRVGINLPFTQIRFRYFSFECKSVPQCFLPLVISA